MTPERLHLYHLWKASTAGDIDLIDNSDWMQLRADIIVGRSLVRWIDISEGAEDPVPEGASYEFLQALDELVEEEAGTDLQHLDYSEDDEEGQW